MNIVQHIAWIGTGTCDPNKDFKQALITAAVLAGWGIIIYLLNKLYRSKQSKGLKIAISILAVVLAAALTFMIYAITLITFACSRHI